MLGGDSELLWTSDPAMLAIPALSGWEALQAALLHLSTITCWPGLGGWVGNLSFSSQVLRLRRSVLELYKTTPEVFLHLNLI